MKVETEIGVMQLQIKEHQVTPKATRSQKKLEELQKESSSASALISDLWAPEPERMDSLV